MDEYRTGICLFACPEQTSVLSLSAAARCCARGRTGGCRCLDIWSLMLTSSQHSICRPLQFGAVRAAGWAGAAAKLGGAVGGPRDRLHREGACAAAQSADGRCGSASLCTLTIENMYSCDCSVRWAGLVIELIEKEHAQLPKLLPEGVPDPRHNETHFTHCSTHAERQRMGVSESGTATSYQLVRSSVHPSANYCRCSRFASGNSASAGEQGVQCCWQ